LEDSQLLAFCLFFAVLGVMALFFLSLSLKPVEKSLNGLSGEDVGKIVLVKGMVSSVFQGSSFNSFDLCYSNCVKIMDFKKAFSVRQGWRVAVEGSVKEYNGELEIIAGSVEVLSS